MKIEHKKNLIRLGVYYAQMALFTLASYGLIFLLYGHTKISLLEWTGIMLVAFTIAYIPSLIGMLRNKNIS